MYIYIYIYIIYQGLYISVSRMILSVLTRFWKESLL